MADYSQLQVLVNANTSGMSRQIAQAAGAAGDEAGRSIGQRLSSSLGSAASAVGRTISTGFTVAVGAAAGFGAAVIASGKSYNVLYQTSSAAFRTILGSGDAAKKMMADLAVFSKTSPFPRQAFIEATQQMLAFGFEAKDVIPTLDAIQNAVAATGGTSKDIGEITNVLSQVQSTGKFTADTLNQLGYRGIDAAKLIGQGMGMTATQVRESITKGTLDSRKALKVLVDQMAQTYAGAAEGVKNTWVGATDRIKGAMRDIGSAIVEPFIRREGGGIALDWANRLADLLRAIEPLVTPIVNALMGKIGPALNRSMSFMEGLIEQISKFSGSSSAVGKLGSAFSEFAPVLAPIAGMMLKVGGANIGAMLGPLGPLVQGVTGAFGPFGMALAAIIAVSPEARGGLGQIAKALGGLVGPVMELVRSLGKQLGPIIAQIVPVIVTLFRELVGIVKAMLPSVSSLVKVLGPTLTIALKGLTPILVVLVEMLAAIIKPLSPLIVAIAAIAAAFWLYNAAAGVAAAVTAVVASPVLLVVGAVALLAAGIYLLVQNWDSVSSAIGTAVKWLGKLASTITGLLSGALKWLLDIGKNIVSGLMSGIKSASSTIWAWFRSLPSEILRLLSGAGSWLTDVGRNAIQSMRNGIDSAVSTIWAFFSNLPGTIVSKVTDMGDKMFQLGKNAIQSIRNGIDNIAGTIWSFFSNLPGTIVSKIDDMGSKMFQLGKGAIESIRNGIDYIAGSIWSFFSNLPGTMLSKIEGLAAAMLGVGRGVIDGIRGGIDSVAGTLWALVASFPGRIVGAIGNMAGAVFGKGAAVISGIRNGISANASRIFGWASGLPGRLAGAVGNIAGSFLGVGKSVVHGIISGIWSMGKSLANAVKNFAKKFIPKPLRKVLKIGSPSKVMRDEIGKMIVAGLVEGIEGGGQDVSRAMSGLVDLPSPAVGARAGVASLPGAGGLASGSGGGPAVEIGNAYFSEQADLDLLMRRATWAVRQGAA